MFKILTLFVVIFLAISCFHTDSPAGLSYKGAKAPVMLTTENAVEHFTLYFSSVYETLDAAQEAARYALWISIFGDRDISWVGKPEIVSAFKLQLATKEPIIYELQSDCGGTASTNLLTLTNQSGTEIGYTVNSVFNEYCFENATISGRINIDTNWENDLLRAVTQFTELSVSDSENDLKLNGIVTFSEETKLLVTLKADILKENTADSMQTLLEGLKIVRTSEVTDNEILASQVYQSKIYLSEFGLLTLSTSNPFSKLPGYIGGLPLGGAATLFGDAGSLHFEVVSNSYQLSVDENNDDTYEQEWTGLLSELLTNSRAFDIPVPGLLK
ncbi:MAG: hypothetical protein OEZ43_02455 [Gammaproteobacteria bacterium]|nr:hypothetical protein [Gammaproteobacteria bacterium]